ncbi:MAG: MerR family transcriptional regulator [bacterium]|nr:MAG: MerR family transcriptional regulator [bacterium]
MRLAKIEKYIKIELKVRKMAAMEFDDNEPVFTIGVAARKLNIAVPTMRMYEKAGLIIPFRNESGRRIYSFADLKRISYIRRLIKSEGLNLAGIRRLMALLPCWELKPCSTELREKCPAYRDCKTICWMFPATACKVDERSCRTCSVYLESCDTTDNLKQILKKTKY